MFFGGWGETMVRNGADLFPMQCAVAVYPETFE
jgi:hypothetical protein